MTDETADKAKTSGEEPSAPLRPTARARRWAAIWRARLGRLFAIDCKVPEDQALKVWCEARKKTHQAAELAAADSLLLELSPADGRDAAGRHSDLKSVQERLFRMIDYAIRRHDWYSDQCHRLLQVGLAFIAAGAAIAAVLTKVGGQPPHLFIWSAPAILAVGGLVQVVLFNGGLAGSYPYRKLSDILSWFYYYRVGSQAGGLSEDPCQAATQIELHSAVITKYFGVMAKHLASPAQLLREDIEQVSILLLLQGYKRDQVKAMSRWLTWTVWALVLAVGVSVFVSMGGQRAAVVGASPGSTPTPAPTPTATPLGTPAPTSTGTPGASATPMGTPTPTATPRKAGQAATAAHRRRNQGSTP